MKCFSARPGRGRLLALAGLLCVAQAGSAADPFDIPAAHPPRVVDASFFGTHFHRLADGATGASPSTAWPQGMVDSVRVWDADTRWADLEPRRGDYRFQRLDAYVRSAREHGASVLMVLGSAPPWAAARPAEMGPYGPGSQSEPADLDAWEDYVATLAARYKGRIAAYELWNEPYFSNLAADRGHDNSFFSGSVDDMVRMADRARAALRREDPSALLLTPGFVGSAERLAMFLDAGGRRDIDGVAWHLYADDDRHLLGTVRDLRELMARRGIADLPLFNTESGFAVGDDAPGGPARAAAASALARSMLLAAWLGVDRYYQYAWDNARSGMVVGVDRAPTPSLRAYASVRRWLVGTTLLGCRHESEGLVACRGSRAGHSLLVLWRSERSGSAKVRLSRPSQVLSIDYASAPVQTGRATPDLAVGEDPVAIWSGVANQVAKP